MRVDEYCLQRLTAQHRYLRENEWTFQELLASRLAMESALGHFLLFSKIHSKSHRIVEETSNRHIFPGPLMPITTTYG